MRIIKLHPDKVSQGKIQQLNTQHVKQNDTQKEKKKRVKKILPDEGGVPVATHSTD